MKANELQINKLAQGLIPIEVGLKWFASSTDAQKLEIMGSLDLCVSQSHPTSEEIIKGTGLSGLRPTYTPCVIVSSRPFREARSKLKQLRGIDQDRAFSLLLAIFSLADQRRRESDCREGCVHEWHNLTSS
ncbi:DUF5958 family protein [Reinekea sp. G2M2-21]|uniref:DUF5958 family protein n=1 Tax=Reinekea sp. G2M2-21 TaxID=2788942 RepID=UPI00351C944F